MEIITEKMKERCHFRKKNTFKVRNQMQKAKQKHINNKNRKYLKVLFNSISKTLLITIKVPMKLLTFQKK